MNVCLIVQLENNKIVYLLEIHDIKVKITLIFY